LRTFCRDEVTKMKAGETAYIVESNRFIREVEIKSCAGGMYLIKFKDSGGGIKVKEHRLFATREDAESSLQTKQKGRTKTPYDYI